MKNYRETSPTRIDNVLGALIVVVVLGSIGFAAFQDMFGAVSA
ncbi:MAG: hypothetical protein ABSF50_15420 [Burkholderiaceae bacterium]|jgi:hypothetical protein